MTRSAAIVLTAAPLLLAPLASADQRAESPLTIDPAIAYTQPVAPADQPGPEGESGRAPAKVELDKPRERRFGRAGSWWWSIGPGVAWNLDDATDVNVHGMLSTFLADGFEFGLDAGAWYFSQDGQDTGGLSTSLEFRWHFLHWGDEPGEGPGDQPPVTQGYRTTVFADLGMGMLAAFDEVPDGGTGFNFMPRVGLGFTTALTDEDPGPRLTAGVRWHHISNARIEGDERNPGRDGVMIYAEIQFPF